MSVTEISLNGSMLGNKHFYPLIVQYEDTDASGVVYHSNYLKLCRTGQVGVFAFYRNRFALLSKRRAENYFNY